MLSISIRSSNENLKQSLRNKFKTCAKLHGENHKLPLWRQKEASKEVYKCISKFADFCVLKMRAGAMAQLLRAQVAIAEELGSVPSTHIINK